MSCLQVFTCFMFEYKFNNMDDVNNLMLYFNNPTFGVLQVGRVGWVVSVFCL